MYYIIHSVLIGIIIYFYFNVLGKPYMFLSGYLSAKAIIFVTGIFLVYRLVEKIFTEKPTKKSE